MTNPFNYLKKRREAEEAAQQRIELEVKASLDKRVAAARQYTGMVSHALEMLGEAAYPDGIVSTGVRRGEAW